MPRVRSVADDPHVAAVASPATGQGTLFRPGQQVAGRYTVVDVIGRGGMGCIYRVRDNTLGEQVALKTLLPQFAQNKVLVDRFLNEARIARQLSHPNIIRVHDIGVADNVIYISMELLKGKPLRNVLDELPPGERLPLDATLRIIDELCAALEYAHRFTVHRDVKPENVMIVPDGSIRLMDFGISKLMASTQMTAASVVMGTPMYMSPEQIRNSRDVDARADVFSIGVVLYEMLTGNIPTGIPKPASHIRRDIPPELDGIINKCVEPNREHRYQNVTELRDALLSIRTRLTPGVQTIATPTPSAAVPARTGPKKVFGLALITAIAALTGFGIWKEEQNQRPAPSKAISDPEGLMQRDTAEFRRIAALIQRALPQAELKAKDDELKGNIVTLAKALWEQAQKGAPQDAASGASGAMEALVYLAAVLDWPDDMVFVPPGEVTLTDGAAKSTIRLDGFFIDKTEVTVDQYLRFCDEAPWRRPQIDLLDDENRGTPITMVTFYDALAYAAYNGKQLPAEAQWARAAHGERGASPNFPWGDVWQPGACNAAGAEGDDEYPGLAPVGSFPEDRTAFGCMDMAGNVTEWTRTASRPLPYDPQDGRDDTQELYFGSQLAIRGGNFKATDVPLSARYCVAFESLADTLGFRCAREAPRTLEDIEALL
jgi:formylglycine-generating enzyme required for sulfatase activity